MIHPLSAEKEIESYLKVSKSSACLALDLVYPKFAEIAKNTCIKNLIITSAADALPPVIKAGYALTEGRKAKKLPKDAPVIRWRSFLKGGDSFDGDYRAARRSADPAVICTAAARPGRRGNTPFNLNFNALGAQVRATIRCSNGDKCSGNARVPWLRPRRLCTLHAYAGRKMPADTPLQYTDLREAA
jgi:long-chain acyl-CoA synthetase